MRDLRRVVALGEQAQHLHLTVAEARQRESSGSQEVPLNLTHLVEQPAQEVRRHRAVAGGGGQNSADHSFGHRVAPPQDRIGPRLDCTEQGHVVDARNDHDHPGDPPALEGADRSHGPTVDLVGHDHRHVRLCGLVVGDDFHLGPRPQLTGDAGC